MTVSDQRHDPLTRPTVPTDTSRLPVAWTPDGAVPPRPRFGLSQEEIEARERSRRIRLSVGIGSALLGLLTMAAGLLLRDAPERDATAEIQRALSLQNAGRLDEAAVIYREVVADEPGATVAYFNLGVIEHTRGLPEQAAANYQQVLALDPEYTPALFNLAVLRADEGDADAAIGLYRRVITIDPNEAGALMNLGILLLERGESVEASELINRAIEIDPSLATTGQAGGPGSSAPAQ